MEQQENNAVPAWSDVESSKKYQDLDYDSKMKVRGRYFDDVAGKNVKYQQADDAKKKEIRGSWMGQEPDDRSFVGNMADIGVESIRTVKDSFLSADDIATGNFDDDYAKRAVAANKRRENTYDPSELKDTKQMIAGVSKDWDEADGFIESAGAAAKAVYKTGKEVVTNPKGVAYLSAESAGNMIPGVAGTVGGALTGGAVQALTPIPGARVVGAMAGGIAGGTIAEAGPKFREILAESLAERKLPFTEENVQALIDDPAFTDEARSRALKKGITTATVDTALGLGTGRIITAPIRAARKQAAKELGKNAGKESIEAGAAKILSKRTLGQKTGNAAKGVSLEVASEPTSELAGQLAADGEVDLGELVGETLGGIGASAVTTPADVYAFGKDSLNSYGAARKAAEKSENIEPTKIYPEEPPLPEEPTSMVSGKDIENELPPNIPEPRGVVSKAAARGPARPPVQELKPVSKAKAAAINKPITEGVAENETAQQDNQKGKNQGLQKDQKDQGETGQQPAENHRLADGRIIDVRTGEVVEEQTKQSDAEPASGDITPKGLTGKAAVDYVKARNEGLDHKGATDYARRDELNAEQQSIANLKRETDKGVDGDLIQTIADSEVDIQSQADIRGRKVGFRELQEKSLKQSSAKIGGKETKSAKNSEANNEKNVQQNVDRVSGEPSTVREEGETVERPAGETKRVEVVENKKSTTQKRAPRIIEPTDEGIPDDLVRIKDNRGKAHYIKKKDFDNPKRTILPRYKRGGERFVNSHGVHRDNLDLTGEKATEAWKDMPLFDGQSGKGYASELQVKKVIRAHGQQVIDYEIKKAEGRFFAIHKQVQKGGQDGIRSTIQVESGKGSGRSVQESNEQNTGTTEGDGQKPGKTGNSETGSNESTAKETAVEEKEQLRGTRSGETPTETKGSDGKDLDYGQIAATTMELEEAITSGRHSLVPGLKAKLEELRNGPLAKNTSKTSSKPEESSTVLDNEPKPDKGIVTSSLSHLSKWSPEKSMAAAKEYEKKGYVSGDEATEIIGSVNGFTLSMNHAFGTQKITHDQTGASIELGLDGVGEQYFNIEGTWDNLAAIGFDPNTFTVDESKAAAFFNVQAEEFKQLEQSKTDQKTTETEKETTVEQKNTPNKGESGTKQDKQSNYGKDNTLVSQSRADEIRAKLKAKLSNLNSGVDPELISLGTELAVYHIEAGAKAFADFSKTMVKDLGEKAKPYLRSWYEGARYFPGLDSQGMSSAEEIEKTQNPVSEKTDTKKTDNDITEKQFRTKLKFKGTARDSEGRDFKIQMRDDESFYYEMVEDGARMTKGPGGPVVWSRETAIEKASADAYFSPETGKDTPKRAIIESEGSEKAKTGGEKDGRDDERGLQTERDPESREPVEADLHGVEQKPQGQRDEPGDKPEDGQRSGSNDSGSGGTDSGRNAPGRSPAGSTRDHVPEKPHADEPDGRAAGNYRLTEQEINDIGKRSETQRIKDNFQAISILKDLQVNGRKATSSEQAALARYSGWGGLNGVFNKRSKRLEKQRNQLAELLTQEEFEAARSSSRTAFYTSPTVVTKLYDAMTRLGVRGGGKMLEPSVGTGNFLGLMPSRFRAGTNITGVELDNITGGIAKALYPDANIAAPLGFQDITLTEGSFDFAMGNPPFMNRPLKDTGKFKPKGPDGKLLKQNVHNFFFAKTLHSLRPGGVMGMVVSHGLMDKADTQDRTYMARHAQLLGAIRLPDTAFLGNTGTSVTTDILFFKKRDTPLEWEKAKLKNWVKTEQQAIAEGEPVEINRYFYHKPEMMLGEMTRGGSMYGPDMATLAPHEGKDLAEELDNAITNLPQNVYEANKGGTAQEAKRDPDIPYGTKVNSYFVTKDGNLKQRESDHEGYQVSGPATRWHQGQSQDVPLNPAQVKRATAMIAVRDSLNTLIAKEQQEDAKPGSLKALRKKLNKDYDWFTAKFGMLHDVASKQAFESDPDYPRLLALEEQYQKKVTPESAAKSGKAPSPAKSRKADIFRERVIHPSKEITKADTAQDALMISLNEKGVVDIERMMELTGKSETALVEELGEVLFNDPNSGYVTGDIYLSGNVKAKLAVAQDAAAKDGSFTRNVAALETVQPEDVEPLDIDVRLSSPWLDERALRGFAEHLLGVSRFTAKYNDILGRWLINVGNTDAAKEKQWGTDAVGASTILEKLITNGSIKVFEKDADGKSHLNIEATQEANAKADEVKREFQEWIWDGGKHAVTRRERLAKAYNDTYNTSVDREYDGSHLKFNGMVSQMGEQPFAMREHQTNATWRGIQDGRILLDHVVGAGKAQPLDAILITPSGPVKMGDISAGDEVISVDGTPTTVEAVFPQGEKEIFKVTFSDGSFTECCKEHLWETWNYRERSYAQRAKKTGKDWDCAKPQVRSLSEIKDTLVAGHLGAKNYSIPITQPVQFAERETGINPYLMGILLADGCSRSGSIAFSTPDTFIVKQVSELAPEGCKVKYRGCYDYVVTYGKENPVIAEFKKTGIWRSKSTEKFIPDIYLINSISNRVALLNGLMDGDGWVSKNGHSTYYSTSSSKLVENVTFLVQSLGGTVSLTEKAPVYQYDGEKRVGQKAYNLCLKLPDNIEAFKLPRQIKKTKKKTKYPAVRYIVDVESVGKKEAQCIRVSHDSHLYLTDAFIVTHNTFTMVATAMESKRMGLTNKPMFVVPNHLIEQWAADFYKLYPGANILAATKKDFQKKNRQKFFSRVATGNWDAVIVAHSSFTQIKTPKAEHKEFLREQIEEYESALEAMKEEGDMPRSIVTQVENQRDKLKETYAAIQARQDDVMDFSEMGVDSLYVDEAHEFKNLGFATRKGNIPGLGSTSGSQKAKDLYVKARMIQKRNKNRGIYFATGTPVSNTLAEMYIMQRYMDSEELKQRRISSFDAWSDVFADTETNWELDATGVRYKQKTRFAKFVNLPEMMALYRSFADVVSQKHLVEMAKKAGKVWPIPKMKGTKPQNIIVERSEIQAAYMDYVVYRAEHMDPRDRKTDNMLKLTTDATKAALDMRLIDPLAPDEPGSKPNRAVSEIFDIYKKWDSRRGAQLVFLDMSAPKKGNAKARKEYQDMLKAAEQGDEKAQTKISKMTPVDIAALDSEFSVYDDMKAKLLAKGIPEDQVAFIHDANTDKQKEELMEKVRTGEIRVLFGSTPKMGAGMNVQKRLVAMHHLDAPWRPSDLEQREGRILRQGNEFYQEDPEGFEITINRYSTKETYDARRWQIIEAKALVIDSLRNFNPGNATRTIEDVAGESANAAEMKAAASGDPRIMEQVKLNGEVHQLSNLRNAHRKKKQRAEGNIAMSERELAPDGVYDQRDEKAQQIIDTAKANPKEPFVIMVNGETYTEPVLEEKGAAAKKKHQTAKKKFKDKISKAMSSLVRSKLETKMRDNHYTKVGLKYRGMSVWGKSRGTERDGTALYNIIALPTGMNANEIPWAVENKTARAYNTSVEYPVPFTPLGYITTMNNILDTKGENILDESKSGRRRAEQNLKIEKDNLPGDFKDQAKLVAKGKRLDELIGELAKEEIDTEALDPGLWERLIEEARDGGSDASFSKTAEPLPPGNRADISGEISKKIGKGGLGRLIRNGVLEIVSSKRAEQILSMVGGAKFSIAKNLEAQIRKLQPIVDAAYKSGDLQRAETLDVQLDGMYEKLDNLLYELDESDGQNIHHTESLDTEDNMERDLAMRYSDLFVMDSNTYGADGTRQEKIESLRVLLEDYAFTQGGMKDNISDEQVFEAAKDAYEVVIQRRENFKKVSKVDGAKFMIGGRQGKSFDKAVGRFSALWDKLERYEIDDSTLQIRHTKEGYFGKPDQKTTGTEALDQMQVFLNSYSGTLGAFDFDGERKFFGDVFDEYPQLLDIDLNINSEIYGEGAEYYEAEGGRPPRISISYAKGKEKNILPMLAHELQHAIQSIEGFKGGGTPFSTSGRWEDGFASDLEKKARYEKYLAVPGEFEARNTVSRLKMTRSERESTPVYSSNPDLDIKYSEDGSRIEGFTLNGKAYLVDGNIAKGQAMAVLNHELGLHVKHLGFKDSKQFASVLRLLERRANNPKHKDSAAIREAMARVPADTPQENRAEETLAYLITSAPDTNIVQRLLAAIKQFLVERMGVTPRILNNLDLQALAVSVVKQESKGVKKSKSFLPPSGQSAMLSGVAPNWYSPLAQAAANLKQAKGSGTQMFAMLKKQPGVKQEEIEWLGLEEFLEGKKSVTRDEIATFVEQNGVQVEEVVKDGDQWVIVNTAEESEYFASEEEARKSYDQEMDWIENDSTVFDASKEKGYVSVGDSESNEVFSASKVEDGTYLAENGNYYDDYGEAVDAGREAQEEQKQYWIDLTEEPSLADDSPGGTRFSDYQLHGGKSYKELLLTLPEQKSPYLKYVDELQKKYGTKDINDILSNKATSAEIDKYYQTKEGGYVTPSPYQSSHFREGNILAHVRFNERTDVNGKKVLFLEEVQSDWHQEGRRKGYKGELPDGWNVIEREAYGTTAYDVMNEKGERVGSSVKSVEDAIDEATKFSPSTVPSAPFKKTWPTLALKRMVRYAAENGFDSVAWTSGEQQAERYDIGNKVSEVNWNPEKEHLNILDLDGDELFDEKGIKEGDLEKYIGKEAAQRLIESKKEMGWHYLKGEGLRTGGAGMKAFYDKMLPAAANKFGKKYGAKVGISDVSMEKGNPGKIEWDGKDVTKKDQYSKQLSFPITPKLKAAALGQGMPLFSKAFNETVSEVAPGTITHIKPEKADMTYLEVAGSTPEYSFRDKGGASERVIEAQLDRHDMKRKNENIILGENYVDKDGKLVEQGEFLDFTNRLSKDDKKAYSEAGRYLVETDQSGYGFRLKSTPEGWVVKDPDGKTLESFGKHQEQMAQQAMINAESNSLREEGYSENAIKAVKLGRELTGRAFGQLIADLRRIQEEAEAAGLPTPLLGEIDEAGRYGVFNGQKLVSAYETEREAQESLENAIKIISYSVFSTKGTKLKDNFKTVLKAEQWAKKHGGDVRQKNKFKNLTIRKRTDNELRPLTLQEAIAQMGDLRGVFFPRLRQPGAFVMVARKDGANPIREHFDIPGLNEKEGWKPVRLLKAALNSATPAGRRMKELQAKGYDVSLKKDDSMSDDVFDATKLSTSLDAILSQAMSVADKNSDDQIQMAKQINKILTLQVADIFKARGYLSTRMKRTEDVWEGYEEDMQKALLQYGKNLAAGIAKRDTAQKMVLAFTGGDYSWTDYKNEVEGADWDEYKKIVEKRRIDPGKQKVLYGQVRNFITDVLRNDEYADRVMGTMKGLAAVKFLGFRLSSAAINMTNMVQAVPATISAHTDDSILRALNRVKTAVSIYGKYRTGKGDLKLEDRDIFQDITARGWDQAQYNMELAGALQSKLGEQWSKFVEASMLMFGAAEKVNRATTIFAAYKALQRKHPRMDYELLMKKAKHVSDRAHGVYGKETLPALARGKYNPLKMTYTFQKFSHNYMLNMLEMGFQKKDWKAASYMLLSPAILAGSGATLATPVLVLMAQALGIGGDDPEEEFYKWAEETFGSDRFARHGMGGLAGVNLKGSLQVNNPMPTKLDEIFGAPQGVVNDVWDGAKHIFNGELYKGFEKLTPTALGNMSKAYREGKEGVTTGSYSSVFYGDEPLKADRFDFWTRFLSFNPARLSGIREKQWNEKLVAKKYQDRRKKINSRIKREFLQADGKISTETWAEIFKEISYYNELVRGSGRADIHPITVKAVKRYLRDIQRAPKRERLRKVV